MTRGNFRSSNHPDICGFPKLGCWDQDVVDAIRDSSTRSEAKHALQYLGKGSKKAWHAYLARVEEDEAAVNSADEVDSKQVLNEALEMDGGTYYSGSDRCGNG